MYRNTIFPSCIKKRLPSTFSSSLKNSSLALDLSNLCFFFSFLKLICIYASKAHTIRLVRGVTDWTNFFLELKCTAFHGNLKGDFLWRLISTFISPSPCQGKKAYHVAAMLWNIITRTGKYMCKWTWELPFSETEITGKFKLEGVLGGL